MAHRVAPRAERDLDDIWHYVAKETGSIEIANRLMDCLEANRSLWSRLSFGRALLSRDRRKRYERSGTVGHTRVAKHEVSRRRNAIRSPML